MEETLTQAVLKNEITDLKPNSPVDADKRREIADMLGHVLADEYRLFVNTQGLHWNVEGPLFYSLHKLTESQYRELFESIDEILAEIDRIAKADEQGQLQAVGNWTSMSRP